MRRRSAARPPLECGNPARRDDPARRPARRPLVNRATLPPDADLVASYEAFAETLTNPGFLARATRLGEFVADKGLEVEYQLGEYTGLVNQNL